MASYAGANHPSMPSSATSSGSSTTRRLGQFPPVPKSVRVVSVFSEGQQVSAPDSPAGTKPEAKHAPAWAPWLLGIIVILGLIAMAFVRSQFWNQPGI